MEPSKAADALNLKAGQNDMADALAYYAKKEYRVELECVRIFMYSTILAISSIKFKYSKIV